MLDWCTMRIDPETGDLKEDYIDKAPYVGKTEKGAHTHADKRPKPTEGHVVVGAYVGTHTRPESRALGQVLFRKGFHALLGAHGLPATSTATASGTLIGIAGIDLSPLSKRDDKTNDELGKHGLRANQVLQMHLFL